MGIVRQSLKFLVHENNYKSIKGNFLSLARQSINIDIEECKKITKKSLKEINFDKSILKDYNIHDLIFHFYPIKYNNNSKYIFSYEKKTYSHCTNYYDANYSKLKKFVTLYFCK